MTIKPTKDRKGRHDTDNDQSDDEAVNENETKQHLLIRRNAAQSRISDSMGKLTLSVEPTCDYKKIGNFIFDSFLSNYNECQNHTGN